METNSNPDTMVRPEGWQELLQAQSRIPPAAYGAQSRSPHAVCGGAHSATGGCSLKETTAHGETFTGTDPGPEL